MENKLKDKIVKNIEWSKSVQDGWQGSFVLPDGYRITVVAHKEMKMRGGKALVKEILPERVEEVAAKRNVKIFAD